MTHPSRLNHKFQRKMEYGSRNTRRRFFAQEEIHSSPFVVRSLTNDLQKLLFPAAGRPARTTSIVVTESKKSDMAYSLEAFDGITQSLPLLLFGTSKLPFECFQSPEPFECFQPELLLDWQESSSVEPFNFRCSTNPNLWKPKLITASFSDPHSSPLLDPPSQLWTPRSYNQSQIRFKLKLSHELKLGTVKNSNSDSASRVEWQSDLKSK